MHNIYIIIQLTANKYMLSLDGITDRLLVPPKRKCQNYLKDFLIYYTYTHNYL